MRTSTLRGLLPALLTALPVVVTAQGEGAAFLHSGKGASLTFATDYQAIGINPANLGWSGKYEGKKAAFGFGEVTSSVYTRALTRTQINENFLRSPEASFTYEDKRNAANAFAGEQFTANIDMRTVGFALTTAKAGGFAFHVADRLQWWSTFNQDVSEILFMGFNAPYFNKLVLVTGDTIDNTAGLSQAQRDLVVRGLTSSPRRIKDILKDGAITHQWVREYAVAWGYLVGTSGLWNFYTGVSARYLQGLGVMEIRSDGNAITAYSALSPGYDINYGEAALSNPSTVGGSGFRTVGSGFSADLGFSAEVAGKYKVGIAYTNVGSITWNGNVYEAFDEDLVSLDSRGFDNYNFFDQAQKVYGDVGVFDWKGRADKRVAMPSQFRSGASMRIKEKTEVGFDVIVPTNKAPGNLEGVVFGVGGEVAPTPWFSVNTGVSAGGMYKVLVPFGLNFRLPSGSWEAGIATRDMPSLFVQDPGMLSYCFGFLRFRV